jgi:HAMP domain-containing protein
MKHRRRIYVVDRKLQLAVAAQLLGVLGGVAALYVVGLLLLSGGGGPEKLTAGEVLRANLIYFLLAAAILGVVALLLTHRIAGPAFVVERAVRAMAKGDHGARLGLRKRDYLKPLAAAVEELRAELERRARACEELRAALDRGDLDAARSLVERVQPAAAREPEPAAR